jgi:hypothetical protein
MSNESFAEYMKTIGVSETLASEFQRQYEFFKNICPEKIEHMFIDDYINQEGTRIFESTNFFSASFAMEAKTLGPTGEYEMALFLPRLRYWSVEAKDFDFKKATDKSRLVFKFVLFEGGGLSLPTATLKASKENCDYLWNLISIYFVPKLQK